MLQYVAFPDVFVIVAGGWGCLYTWNGFKWFYNFASQYWDMFAKFASEPDDTRGGFIIVQPNPAPRIVTAKQRRLGVHFERLQSILI